MQFLDDSLLPENQPPLVIQVAPYGPEFLPGDSDDIPVTMAEQVQKAVDCWNAGATVLHVHCREADGKRYLVMIDDLGVRWMYYDAQTAAAHFKPREEFYVQQDFSWDQVRDVQVFRHNWPRRFGRVVLSVAPQETEAPDETAELNLMYFENNETAESFAEEVLYRFVKSR